MTALLDALSTAVTTLPIHISDVTAETISALRGQLSASIARELDLRGQVARLKDELAQRCDDGRIPIASPVKTVGNVTICPAT